MHADARRLQNKTLIEGDICIVGAGAAGISMALDWDQTKYKVILLEGGGFEYDQEIQELYAGKTTGQPYFPLMSSRLHYFGGTTGHWAGFCSPMDPVDFAKRNWVENSGWPINKEDLDPFYERAQIKLELGPYNYDMAFWQKDDPAMLPLVKNDSVIRNKMWQFSPPTRFGEKYKKSIVESRNIHLYTYTNVVEIRTNETGSAVTELIVKNFEGRQHRVRAKKFILACCAIQNARLLLASNQQTQKGLGNQNDLVGRYFMEHLEIKSAELWLFKPSPLKLYGFNFGVTKARAELAIHPKKQEEFQILNGTVSLTALEVAKKIKPAIERWNQEDPRKSGDRFFGGYSAAGKDSHIPASGTNSYQEEVGRARMGRLKLMDYLADRNDNSWPDFTGGGWHHMGTTRMSNDPKQGVVDSNCKVHGISNLYMAGSSCFTTAGAPNPTLTLVALTLRLSDHVKKLM
jgi:choline dehydrogenase-like flavoprotein